MSHVADIPLTLLENKLFMPVTMNGTLVRLAMDTGADMTVLSTASYERLNIPRDFDHTEEALGVGGVDNHLYTVEIEHMSLGSLGFGIRHLPVADFDMKLPDGEPMGGLLGADILSQFDIDLDIPRRTAGFWRVSDCTTVAPPWGDAPSSVPLTHKSRHLMALEIKLDQVPVQLELDTGASYLLVGERDAARAGVPPETIEAGPAMSGRGVNDGVYIGHVHVFDEVRLGGARYERVPAVVVPRSRLSGAEGLLGVSFLLQHRVWISYATDTLFVQDAPSPP